ncbi:hypothetical protein C0992_003983 [Termitomyces sp. T32_za158]|nr:hypothetical protein C0992_003983 [Termitomyces sp. T32_za158]
MSNDLRQISELFRDLISLARAQQDHDLDGAAADWLKEARLSILKDIERSYHELSANATNLLLVPYWAVDPSTPLSLFTPDHPRTLDSYSDMFLQEIRKLMADCGFVADVLKVSGDKDTAYSIKIRFPSDTISDPSPCDTLKTLKIHQRFTLHITEDPQEAVTPAE